MQTLVNRKRGVLLRAFGVGLVLLFGAIWVAKGYVAQVVARKPSVGDYQLAIKLDPGNEEYHLQLGRLYEYVPSTEQPQMAAAEFRRAAELDPNDPQPWIDLAAAAEFQGDISQAGKYLREADDLAPRLPDYQWPIGNFYLLHGDTAEAFRHFKVVLAGETGKYNMPIFSTAWKASGDPATILKDLIPNVFGAEMSYIWYLMDHQKYVDTMPVWDRIAAGPSDFTPEEVSSYIEGLIDAHEVGNALQVWTDLQKKGIVRYATPKPVGNLVTNGDFEDKILGMGFDWRISSIAGTYAGVDTSNYHSPSHSLLVGFTGKQNLDYRQVYQYIPVKPSTSYRLQAFMMTDGITTDSGPRLEVRDAYNPAALDVLSPSMIGDSNGWTPIQLDFKTGPKTNLLLLSLTRLPSQKFDNLIAGKVWLDDVSLTTLSM
jgi:hypothetical protein